MRATGTLKHAKESLKAEVKMDWRYHKIQTPGMQNTPNFSNKTYLQVTKHGQLKNSGSS
jgi:hypothetical protein